MFTNEQLAQHIINQFGDNVGDFDDPYDLLTFSTSRAEIVAVVSYLQNDPTLQVNFLTDITAVHYPDSPGKEYCVVYHMHSFIHNFRLRIKVFLTADDLHIPT
ncbi:MAG: NADH-quinone oxidoreductase subunit C, partial [Cytophagaceae bacterium]